MGITGLLPLLKPIHNNTHISEFTGKTLAVDGYVWLHKGAYACAADLVTGKKTTKYVDYVLHRIRLLRHHNIKPYVVFDGGHLPAKQGTETERKKRREENLAQAHVLAKAGKHSEAREYFVKCVDITPKMAYQVIKALRAESVSYIVAPYEADAQLAYLEAEGIVDGIITEDSDLLVFGARHVLLKFETSGTLTAISRAEFGSIHTDKISLVGWSDVQFREMAILSGCDYLPSIQGIGLITAAKLLRKHKTVEKVLQFIRLEGTKKIPKDYLKAFRMAELAFKHQRVYDPRSQRLVYFTEPPCEEEWDEDKEAYVGRDLDPAIAKGIAEGDIDPITHKPMEDMNPNYTPSQPRSHKRLPLVEITRPNIPVPEKATPVAEKVGILSYFTPVTKSIGRASGKTTLTDIMYREEQLQSLNCIKGPPTPNPRTPRKASRFFGNRPPDLTFNLSSVNASSKRSRESLEPSTPRRVKCQRQTKDDFDEKDRLGEVVQEDGYLSPLSAASARTWTSASGMTSPHDWTPQKAIDFNAEEVSSPLVHCHSKNTLITRQEANMATSATDLPDATQPSLQFDALNHNRVTQEETGIIKGPDLQSIFLSDDTDVEIFVSESPEREVPSATKSPATPDASGDHIITIEDESEVIEEDIIFRENQLKISEGWRKAYSFQRISSSSSFTLTPASVTSVPPIHTKDSSPLLNRRHSAPIKEPPMNLPFPKTNGTLAFTAVPQLKRSSSLVQSGRHNKVTRKKPRNSHALPVENRPESSQITNQLDAFRFRG